MKSIVINSWTLLFPHGKIDLYKDRWTTEIRTYPSRRMADSEAKCFELYDQTKGRWPRPVRIKVTVQA